MGVGVGGIFCGVYVGVYECGGCGCVRVCI